MSKTAIRRSESDKKKINDGKKNKGLFAEVHTVAPAPSRDYYVLRLYQKKFLWTRWKISHGPYANPIQKTIPLESFLRDTTLQNELTYIFGADTTNLIKDLAYEKWSLISLPSHVLQKIISYISVPDILRLSQVSKRLSKECSKNELWRSICKKQWKILVHGDIEKAGLIGWKNVYLEKMRPKRHRVEPIRPRTNPLHRIRTNSASTLNTPDSRTSTAKSNCSIHKRIQELKTESVRSTSEIFGRDFKTISTSTGKSTERTIKTRCNSRNNDFRTFSSGKLNATLKSYTDGKYSHKTSKSALNMVPLVENPKEDEAGHKSPRKVKCKVLNVLGVPRTSQSLTFRSEGLKKEKPRPSTGKFVRAK